MLLVAVPDAKFTAVGNEKCTARIAVNLLLLRRLRFFCGRLRLFVFGERF
jgi:hypothetical protein